MCGVARGCRHVVDGAEPARLSKARALLKRHAGKKKALVAEGLSGLFRAEYHQHLTAFELRISFNLRGFLHVFLHPHEQCHAELLV